MTDLQVALVDIVNHIQFDEPSNLFFTYCSILNKNPEKISELIRQKGYNP
jgi:hypothetical protein